MFDGLAWLPVVMILAGPSMAMMAIQLTLVGFAPELAERTKQNFPTMFLGIILLSISGSLVTAFVTAAAP